eukprot:907741_1
MISGIMELWNADKALMQYGYTLDAMLAQQQTIKQRLFVLISTGQFDAIHDKLCRFTKKKMKYKWRPYNTVLWLIYLVDKHLWWLQTILPDDEEVQEMSDDEEEEHKREEV